MHYEEVNYSEYVIRYGDKGDWFYLILKGVVSVEIPNPTIKNWKTDYEEYIKLKQWRETVLEEKIKIAQTAPEFQQKQKRMS